jgi:hypothetical protein
MFMVNVTGSDFLAPEERNVLHPNQPSRSSGAKKFLLACCFNKHFVPPGLQPD